MKKGTPKKSMVIPSQMNKQEQYQFYKGRLKTLTDATLNKMGIVPKKKVPPAETRGTNTNIIIHLSK